MSFFYDFFGYVFVNELESLKQLIFWFKLKFLGVYKESLNILNKKLILRDYLFNLQSKLVECFLSDQ